MTYLLLFLELFKIGMFAFGGAYGAIPLIQESILRNGWMDETMFANMLAISESTPGPIMVNAATYIGSRCAGVPGAVFATLGVVLPSFIIILLVSIFLGQWLKSKGVQSVLRGIKPCLMGVILATGAFMAYSILTNGVHFDFSALLILIILIAVLLLYQKIRKKEFSPLMLIIISAVLGIVLY
ncbi:chromate transporter [uncultured Oscillibacter sp.]|uniref:chromate transporter n=1 Tax=uncultured Oscillibacter sp. TaxID=876091 RepID=UPI00260F2FAE|nr:chromate transporter [uncultured Oscillibacter sp.]